jgi:hypothetical protein
MLLRPGRVYPKDSTRTQEHHRGSPPSTPGKPMLQLTWVDLIACVDGLTVGDAAGSKHHGVSRTCSVEIPCLNLQIV